MKFVMMLIKILSAVLLASLFGMFIYFSKLQQNSQQFSSYAGFALFLFVLAALILALSLIWLENIPDNTPQTIKQSTNNEQLKPQIEQISKATKHMNKVLNMALENFNNRLDGLEGAAAKQNIVFNEKMRQLQQNFPKIFKNNPKDDLAETLSSLEILKDALQDEPDYRNIDVNEIIGSETGSEKK